MSLKDDIDAAWRKLYDEGAPASEDDAVASRRLAMIADDLRCTRDNFRVTNRAYSDLDHLTRDPRRIDNIVGAIWNDLQSRAGFDGLMDSIDDETRDAIKADLKSYFMR